MNTIACTAATFLPGSETIASIFETNKSNTLVTLSAVERLVTPLIPKDSFDLDYEDGGIGPFGRKFRFVAYMNGSQNGLWQLLKLDIKTGRMIIWEFQKASFNIDPSIIKTINIHMLSSNGNDKMVFEIIVAGPKVTRIMKEDGTALVLIEFDRCFINK